MEKQIAIHYYAQFREARGRSSETVTTRAESPRELFEEMGLGAVYPLNESQLKVAVNDEFSGWDVPLQNGDSVVFITPMAGG